MIPFHSHSYVCRPSTYISSKLFLSTCHPGFDSNRRADATYEFLFLSHFINVIFSPLFSNIINALFFYFHCKKVKKTTTTFIIICLKNQDFRNFKVIFMPYLFSTCIAQFLHVVFANFCCLRQSSFCELCLFWIWQ